MAPWWPARCRAWLGGLCAARWPIFQPHLAAAVPGSELSPFVRRHVAVVASERTGCLISQLRREPPHFSKCRQKICLLLLSPVPPAPGSGCAPPPLSARGRREGGQSQRWRFGWKLPSRAGCCPPAPRASLAEAQPCTLPSSQPCGSGPAKAVSGWFLLLFPEQFHSCDSVCS